MAAYFLLALIAWQAARAQTAAPTFHPVTTASIHGVVMGRSGSVYEGAQVALAIPGAAARQTITDAAGRFNFADASTGEFTLTVRAQGFQAKTLSGTLTPEESYEAPPIELLTSTAVAEVRVTATQGEIAQEQLRDEEKQRVLGIVPNFDVVYVPDAPPLNSRQKFELVWKMSVDPFTLLTTGLSAGIDQANNDYKGYGQGTAGYARRFGAEYGDNVIGTVLGSAILPTVFKQDPRYFYKGTGSVRSRVLYAIAASVMCKGDNGRWQPNYSRIIAGPAAGGISNLYLPAGDRQSAGSIFENAAVSKAMGAVQNIFQEFVVKKLTPKTPIYGRKQPSAAADPEVQP